MLDMPVIPDIPRGGAGRRQPGARSKEAEMRGFILASMALVSPSNLAEAAPEAPTVALQGLSSCLAMTDDHQRLGCLDTEAAKLIAAAKSHDIMLLGRKDMQETRRGLFGYALPKMSLFGNHGSDGARDDVAEIDAVVQSATSSGHGNWRMKLDNGAVWETTEEVTWDPPHPGSKVHIKRGALGSYFMTIDRASPIRAMRIS
jgi:hypothetical protein